MSVVQPLPASDQARERRSRPGSVRSLKILHVLDHGLPIRSGYSIRSDQIFRCQRARGWDPVVVTSPKHAMHSEGDVPLLERIHDVDYYRTPTVASSRLPGLTEMRVMRALRARIADVVRAERPDVIHAHSPWLDAVPARSVAREAGLPFVYEIRAFWEDAAVNHGTYAHGSLKYRLVRAMETRVCRQADHVFVLCEGLRHDLVLRGVPVRKLTPIYNGASPGMLGEVPTDGRERRARGLVGKRVVGFVGSFYRYEGLDLLIEAVAKITARRDDVVLLLVGGGPAERELRELAETCGVESRVLFAGRVPPSHVPVMYSLIDLLVYPRRSIRLTEIVTPLKPLEAMSAGKPFIVSDVGGHREIVPDSNRYRFFPADRVDDLATRIEEVLDDADCRARMVREGLDWMRTRFTWEVTTHAHGEVYDRLAPPR